MLHDCNIDQPCRPLLRATLVNQHVTHECSFRTLSSKVQPRRRVRVLDWSVVRWEHHLRVHRSVDTQFDASRLSASDPLAFPSDPSMHSLDRSRRFLPCILSRRRRPTTLPFLRAYEPSFPILCGGGRFVLVFVPFLLLRFDTFPMEKGKRSTTRGSRSSKSTNGRMGGRRIARPRRNARFEREREGGTSKVPTTNQEMEEERKTSRSGVSTWTCFLASDRRRRRRRSIHGKQVPSPLLLLVGSHPRLCWKSTTCRKTRKKERRGGKAVATRRSDRSWSRIACRP